MTKRAILAITLSLLACILILLAAFMLLFDYMPTLAYALMFIACYLSIVAFAITGKKG